MWRKDVMFWNEVVIKTSVVVLYPYSLTANEWLTHMYFIRIYWELFIVRTGELCVVFLIISTSCFSFFYPRVIPLFSFMSFWHLVCKNYCLRELLCQNLLSSARSTLEAYGSLQNLRTLKRLQTNRDLEIVMTHNSCCNCWRCNIAVYQLNLFFVSSSGFIT